MPLHGSVVACLLPVSRRLILAFCQGGGGSTAPCVFSGAINSPQRGASDWRWGLVRFSFPGLAGEGSGTVSEGFRGSCSVSSAVSVPGLSAPMSQESLMIGIYVLSVTSRSPIWAGSRVQKVRMLGFGWRDLSGSWAIFSVVGWGAGGMSRKTL